MYAGMPVSSLLARSPGPCQTNQPSPIDGDDRRDHGQDGEQDLVVLGPRAAQDRDQSLRAEHRGEHEAAVQDHEHHRDAGPYRPAGERERDEGERRGGEGGDRRDQPGDEHRDPGRPGDQRQHCEHDEQRAEPPRTADVAAEPADQEVGEAQRRVGLTSGLHEEQRAGAVPQRRQPPRREQHRAHAEGDQGRTPDGAVARQAAGDGHRERREHHAQHHREDPGHGGEGRGQGEEQAGAPGGAPATVGLGVGEAERRVGDPRHQDRGHHHAEPAVAPGAGGDRHQRVGDRAERDQPARRAAGVDQSADDAEHAPGSPQGQGYGEQQQRRDGRRGAVAQHRAEDRHRRDVRRRGYAGAGAQRVPRLDPELPQRLCVGRRRSQSPAGHQPERLAHPDDREHHDDAQGHGERVGEEPCDQAGVLGDRVLVVGHDDRSAQRCGGRGLLGGAAPVGDVLRLVGRGRGDVTDEVEAVPVGHPPGREQRLGVVLAGRLARLAGAPDLTRADVDGEERREVVECLAHRADDQEADHPQQGAEEEAHGAPRARTGPTRWPAA